MALYPNGSYMSRSPGRHFGGATAAVGGSGAGFSGGLRNRADRMNRFLGSTASLLDSVPTGYGIDAFVPARRAGGMAASYKASLAIEPTGSAVAGLPGTGTADFSINFAAATGGLISSGTGSATLNIATTATILATRSGSGSATIAITTNTPLLGALGWVSATGAFSVTATMQSYARGYMTGSTVDTSSIVNANIVSVNGYSVTGNGQPGTEWGPA